jgi:hypothetical protein
MYRRDRSLVKFCALDGIPFGLHCWLLGSGTIPAPRPDEDMSNLVRSGDDQ